MLTRSRQCSQRVTVASAGRLIGHVSGATNAGVATCAYLAALIAQLVARGTAATSGLAPYASIITCYQKCLNNVFYF